MKCSKTQYKGNLIVFFKYLFKWFSIDCGGYSSVLNSPFVLNYSWPIKMVSGLRNRMKYFGSYFSWLTCWLWSICWVAECVEWMYWILESQMRKLCYHRGDKEAEASWLNGKPGWKVKLCFGDVHLTAYSRLRTVTKKTGPCAAVLPWCDPHWNPVCSRMSNLATVQGCVFFSDFPFLTYSLKME